MCTVPPGLSPVLLLAMSGRCPGLSWGKQAWMGFASSWVTWPSHSRGDRATWEGWAPQGRLCIPSVTQLLHWHSLTHPQRLGGRPCEHSHPPCSTMLLSQEGKLWVNLQSGPTGTVPSRNSSKLVACWWHSFLFSNAEADSPLFLYSLGPFCHFQKEVA